MIFPGESSSRFFDSFMSGEGPALRVSREAPKTFATEMDLSRKVLSRGRELRMFKTTENTEAAFAGTEGVLGM